MNIYLSHSSGFDYQKELYEPIMQSDLYNNHEIILPHEESDQQFDSKSYLKNTADLIIAEVSYPSTGQGIELGWANVYKVPILCIYKKDCTYSKALTIVANVYIKYSSDQDLISKLSETIENHKL